MRESVPRTGRKPAGELPLQRRTVAAPSVQRSSRPGACACGGGCPRCAGAVLQRSPEDEALPTDGGSAAKGDWTPPPATTYPDVSEDPRVVKKRPASFPGNPPPPVGWKYWPVSKKVTPAAKKLADIGKAPETVPGTFVRDMVGGELIAVRSEWHSFTVLGDEKKPGLYKGGSLMVPVDAPKTQSAEPEGTLALQRQPAVSQPGDRFEREADAVADRVMRFGQAPSQQEQPQAVSRGVPSSGTGAGEAGLDAQTAARVAGQGGEPLSAPLRDFFEPRFGQDLSGVRVHTGAAAEEGARAVQARAYTLGTDIVFGAGEFAPHSDSGRHLLAHELTHVLQQQGAPMQPLRRQPAPATATSTAPTTAATPPDPLAAALTDSEWRQVDLWMSRGVIGVDKLGANAAENANLIAANLFCERALYAPEFREGDLPPVCLFPRLATDNPRVVALSKEVARFGPLVHWPAVPLDSRLVRAMDRLVDVHAFSVNAAAGIVGNLFVESKLLPSRIEGSDENTPMRSPGFSGKATDFAPPDVKDRSESKQVGPQPPGIGLGQWTTPARRDALFARQGQGASILFDMDAQIDFLVSEVRAVRGLDAALMRAGISADAASDEFLYQFEIPKSITDGHGGKRPRSDPAVQKEFGTRRGHSQSALRAYRKAHP